MRDVSASVSFRCDNLEIRSCDQNLGGLKAHSTLEIVRWEKGKKDKEYCFTLAYWRLAEDRYELRFVSDRPFADEVNEDDFWIFCRLGQAILEECSFGPREELAEEQP